MAEELTHRSFVSEDNKFEPMQQTYNGFEIEKRYVLMTKEEDHTKNKNGLERYNEVLEKGKPIRQGYIKDFDIARDMLEDFSISLAEGFKPNTVRLRQYGEDYILTLKDRKETKKREVEWALDRKQFNKWWKHTEGARVEKRRLRKKIKGYLVEFDAFTDRFLLLAEIEVADEKELKLVPVLGMDVTNNNTWTNKTLSK
jgi:CYTH domain-containing protein